MNIKKVFNNKGVTLVEIIIVLAISAVLVGMIGLSLSIINSADTQKSASGLKSVISKARTQSMAKGNIDGQLFVIKAGDGLRTAIGSAGATDSNISGRRIKVFFGVVNTKVETTAGLYEISSGSVNIQFNTAGMVTNVIANTSASAVNGTHNNNNNIYEFAFKVGKRVDAVVLYPVTGKTETLMWYE